MIAFDQSICLSISRQVRFSFKSPVPILPTVFASGTYWQINLSREAQWAKKIISICNVWAGPRLSLHDGNFIAASGNCLWTWGSGTPGLLSLLLLCFPEGPFINFHLSYPDFWGQLSLTTILIETLTHHFFFLTQCNWTWICAFIF